MVKIPKIVAKGPCCGGCSNPHHVHHHHNIDIYDRDEQLTRENDRLRHSIANGEELKLATLAYNTAADAVKKYEKALHTIQLLRAKLIELAEDLATDGMYGTYAEIREFLKETE